MTTPQKEREKLDIGYESKATPVFVGNFCCGPTLADMEKNMASASLSRGVGDGKGYSGNTCLTWKWRARSEQAKADLGGNLENLGKRGTRAHGKKGEGVGKKIQKPTYKNCCERG
jgi:hypothetical protein